MRKSDTWRSDAGSVLVETIVSAVVIALVVLGVFATIDASSRASGREKTRAVAMSLAEQDLERLRGMRVADLAALRTPAQRTVLVSGITYTVESQANWLRDAGGTPSCTSDATQSDYLKVRSTVTSPAQGTALKPVVLRTTINPPVSFARDYGTLAVKVVDRLGTGVPNVTVGLSGAASETTNAAGCAVFEQIRQGAYDVTLNQAGWVNTAGENPAVAYGVRVNPGRVNVHSISYDRAGSVQVSFATCGGTAAPCTTVADAGHAVSVANPGLPAGGRVFAPAASPSSTAAAAITAGGLFPFTSPYAVYSGRCASQHPEGHMPDYFATNPGRVQVAPGGSYAVTVLESSLNVALYRGNQLFPRAETGSGQATVVARLQGACQDVIVFTGDLTAASQIHPNSTLTPDTTKRGTLKLPGLPFGIYSVCVDDGVRKAPDQTVDLRTLPGSAVRRFDVPTVDPNKGPTGICAR